LLFLLLCRVAESVFDYNSHYDHLMTAAQQLDVAMRGAVAAAAAMGSGSGSHAQQQAIGINGGIKHSTIASGGHPAKTVAFAAGTSPGDDDDGLDMDA
jgi:hypothetical protein